jgi:hypothetical protein
LTEIAQAFEVFFTGREWREVSPDNWQQVENGMGFRNAQTGQLIPAFRAGTIPSPAPFPCIVYPVPNSAAFTNTTANIVYIYDRRPGMPRFLALIDDVLRQMKESIPLGGKSLILPDKSQIRLDFVRCETMRDFDDTTGATMQGMFFFNARSRTNL